MTNQAVIWVLAGVALSVAGASVAPYLSAQPRGTALVVASADDAMLQPAAFRSDCKRSAALANAMSLFAITADVNRDGKLVVSLQPLKPGAAAGHAALLLGIDTAGGVSLRAAADPLDCGAEADVPPAI